MNKTILSPLLLLLTTSFFVGCNQSSEQQPSSAGEQSTSASQVEFANYKCPIMGGKPSPKLTAEYDGKTIGFCCEGCPEKWAALSDEEKAKKFAAVSLEAQGADEADATQQHSRESHNHDGHDHGTGDQDSDEA